MFHLIASALKKRHTINDGVGRRAHHGTTAPSSRDGDGGGEGGVSSQKRSSSYSYTSAMGSALSSTRPNHKLKDERYDEYGGVGENSVSMSDRLVSMMTGGGSLTPSNKTAKKKKGLHGGDPCKMPLIDSEMQTFEMTTGSDGDGGGNDDNAVIMEKVIGYGEGEEGEGVVVGTEGGVSSSSLDHLTTRRIRVPDTPRKREVVAVSSAQGDNEATKSLLEGTTRRRPPQPLPSPSSSDWYRQGRRSSDYETMIRAGVGGMMRGQSEFDDDGGVFRFYNDDDPTMRSISEMIGDYPYPQQNRYSRRGRRAARRGLGSGGGGFSILSGFNIKSLLAWKRRSSSHGNYDPYGGSESAGNGDDSDYSSDGDDHHHDEESGDPGGDDPGGVVYSYYSESAPLRDYPNGSRSDDEEDENFIPLLPMTGGDAREEGCQENQDEGSGYEYDCEYYEAIIENPEFFKHLSNNIANLEMSLEGGIPEDGGLEMVVTHINDTMGVLPSHVSPNGDMAIYGDVILCTQNSDLAVLAMHLNEFTSDRNCYESVSENFCFIVSMMQSIKAFLLSIGVYDSVLNAAIKDGSDKKAPDITTPTRGDDDIGADGTASENGNRRHVNCSRLASEEPLYSMPSPSFRIGRVSESRLSYDRLISNNENINKKKKKRSAKKTIDSATPSLNAQTGPVDAARPDDGNDSMTPPPEPKEAVEQCQPSNLITQKPVAPPKEGEEQQQEISENATPAPDQDDGENKKTDSRETQRKIPIV